MKKIFTASLLLMAACMVAYAQDGITLPEKPQGHEYIDYSARNQGFFAAAQVSPTVFFSYLGKARYVTQLDFVAGYRVNEFIKVGVGVSPKISFDNFSKAISYLPIYLDLRGNFIPQEDRMFSPYWNLDVGYTLNAGFTIAPTLGLKFGGLRNNFLVGLGYVGQSMANDRLFINGAVLRLGYEF